MHDTDDDLPWDPLWAYVLGEEEDAKKGLFKRQKKPTPKGEGIMSYVKDVLHASESRDSRAINVGQDSREVREDPKRIGYAWRRNPKVEDSEAEDAWEWKISTGSYDDVATPPPHTTNDPQKTKEKRSILFGRNDPSVTESAPLKDTTRTKGKSSNVSGRSSRALEAKSSDSWEWHLSTGSDDMLTSNTHPSRSASKTQPKKGATFSSPFRRKQDNDSWDWQLSKGKKENRSFAKRFSKSNVTDRWDFMTATSQERGARRVRFARSNGSKDDVEWIDTKEVVAQLERSQTSLFDWVGINPSYEEDESSQKVGRRHSASSNDKKQKRTLPSTSDSNNLFSGLFSWDDLSEDESSFQSSTDDSSAATVEEYSGSDDDSRSISSLVHDNSKQITREINEDDRQDDLPKEHLNEVRLSFLPIENDEKGSSRLPKIEEETSSTDSTFGFPTINSDNRQLKAPIESQSNGIVVERDTHVDNRDESEQSGKDSIPNSHSIGRSLCGRVKKLTPEQRKWTEENGIPFHELSVEKQSRLFPKNRAIADSDKQAPSSAISDPQESNDSQLSGRQPSFALTGPLSCYEYEYATGKNTFLSYDCFGNDSLTVVCAPTPEAKCHDESKVQNEVLVMVEVCSKNTQITKSSHSNDFITIINICTGFYGFCYRLCDSSRLVVGIDNVPFTQYTWCRRRRENLSY
jgi:hypothetical protein